MPVLMRYLGRQFLANVIFVMIGFAALLQVFDLLKNADEVIARHSGDVSALLTYALLRLPGVIEFVMPFSVLLGSLLVLAKLAHFNEVTAIRGTGRSIYRILTAFFPIALSFAVLQFALANYIVPNTEEALVKWRGQTEEDAVRADPSLAMWLSEDGMLVRVGAVTEGGRSLQDLTLIRRNEAGHVRVRLHSNFAQFTGSAWELRGVRRLEISDDGREETVSTFETMTWHSKLDPARFEQLRSPPSQLPVWDLMEFVANPGLATHPLHVYKTWIHQRLATPIATFLMILLAAPVAGGFGRRGGIGTAMLVGFLLGFLYFVSDGLLLAMGESAALPPLLAAWTPTVVFASLGAALLVHLEGV